MTDLSSAVDTLYDNRQKFIVIGLTGRTGSGCSSAADFLTKKIEDLKLPKPNCVNNNEERKYRIVHDFAQKNWKPFHWIQIKDIITSFILEESFTIFLESCLKHMPDANPEKLKTILQTEIEPSYTELFEIRKDLKKLRDETEKGKVFDRVKIEDRRIKSYKFYFDLVPPFTEKLKSTLVKLSGESYTTLYQIVGDNIRSSGKAFDSTFNPKNILRLAIRVNKLIKLFTNRARSGKNEVYIVIDAIRNPFEALFFKERYSAFYLMAINTNNKDRIHRLKKILNLNEQQLISIDQKEYENKLKGSENFYSQNLSKCIEFADIHLNNPQIGESNFNTLKKQLAWYISLIMHPGLVTPSRREHCMQVAYTAKLNSACLSRQVGAAVSDEYYNVKSVGWNSTAEGQPPCAFRSAEHLIENEDPDAYSYYEKNDKKFRDLLREKYQPQIDSPEALKKLKGRNLSFCFKSIQNEIEKEKNQVHTRSLHAEENAFLQLAKYGGPGIAGGILFSTASPCELCAKKAYQLQMKKVYYIDPYPGISEDHIFNIGPNPPQLQLFHGAIGRAYNHLFEPILPYKDELSFILNF